MVGAGKANRLTDQFVITNNDCFFNKCHAIVGMKVMGPSDKTFKKQKYLVTLSVGKGDKAVYVTSQRP